MKQENPRSRESQMRSRIGLHKTNLERLREKQSKEILQQLEKIASAKAEYQKYLEENKQEQK